MMICISSCYLLLLLFCTCRRGFVQDQTRTNKLAMGNNWVNEQLQWVKSFIHSFIHSFIISSGAWYWLKGRSNNSMRRQNRIADRDLRARISSYVFVLRMFMLFPMRSRSVVNDHQTFYQVHTHRTSQARVQLFWFENKARRGRHSCKIEKEKKGGRRGYVCARNSSKE